MFHTHDNSERVWRVINMLKDVVNFSTGKDTYFCAYLAHSIKSKSKPYTTLSEEIESAAEGDSYISTALESILPNINAERFSAMIEKLSTEDLRAYLLSGPAADSPMSSECSTPTGIAMLALQLLDVKGGDRVVDFGSGDGNFLENTAKECNDAQLVGVEVNPSNLAISRMRTKISGSQVTYKCGDMFEYYEDAIANNKVDKAFSNYPWGMRAKYLVGKSEYLENVIKGLSEYGRPSSADWVFNRLLLDSIKDDGVAVGIMTNGSAFNGADAKVRKYFIENGWIKAAISLPAGVFFPWTNIATTLVVLSHENTNGVRLVDATDLGFKERRGTTLTEEDIRTIIVRLNKDSEKSALVSVAELAKREYILSAKRLLQKEIELVNPIAMKDVILDVTRGAGIRAKELDDLTCAEDTGVHYLNLANIVDGSIDDDLPCLKKLDPKLEKYCLETGDLLLSKNGAPYKIAVAEVEEGRKILANGNLYIIKLDTTKVDPYYVAAFLSSPKGKESLARASKDGTIPNLPLGELRAIKIPLESPEKQVQIAAAYQAKLDEIGILKLRLSRARQELIDLFDEEA